MDGKFIALLAVPFGQLHNYLIRLARPLARPNDRRRYSPHTSLALALVQRGPDRRVNGRGCCGRVRGGRAAAFRGDAALPVVFADLVIVPVPPAVGGQQVAPGAGAGGRGGAGSWSRHQAAGRAQPLSGGVCNPKLVLHPARHARLGVGQRGIERRIAQPVPPDSSD